MDSRRRRIALWLPVVLALGACAGLRPVLDTRGVDETVTVDRALADPEGTRNRTVQWGGMIVGSENLKEATRIEVLSYPLDRTGRPRTSEPPAGRFLVLKPGYLETAVFAQGRLVTAVGPVVESRKGKIGEMEYTYPTVSAEQLHLWPAGDSGAEPRVHFGFGVGIGKTF